MVPSLQGLRGCQSRGWERRVLLLQLPQHQRRALGDEGDGAAGAAGARGAPHAVHVVLAIGGHVVVDDHVHLRNVQPPACHVRRRQDVAFARLEVALR